jgi:hypothetical protein
LDPGFVDSNPAEDDGILKAIKMCTMTSFRGELKPAVICCKILWPVKDPCSLKRDSYF